MSAETVFTYAAPALKFGSGASAEIGHDLVVTGARRVLVVTDPGVAATGHPQRIAEQIAAYGAGDQIHVEDLAAYLAGGERCDARARWQQLRPAYEAQAAGLGSAER